MQADRLSHVTSVVAGVAKCPYSPHHNATYIMTSDANFYTATVTDFTARDPAIYRMMGGAKYLRTAQYNSRWLNGIIIIIIITEFLVRLLHKEHRCITES